MQIPIVQSSGNSSQGGMMMPGGGFPSGELSEEEMEGSEAPFGGGAPSGGRGGN